MPVIYFDKRLLPSVRLLLLLYDVLTFFLSPSPRLILYFLSPLHRWSSDSVYSVLLKQTYTSGYGSHHSYCLAPDLSSFSPFSALEPIPVFAQQQQQ